MAGAKARVMIGCFGPTKVVPCYRAIQGHGAGMVNAWKLSPAFMGLDGLRKNFEWRMKIAGKYPSAAKAGLILLELTYGLKPVPFNFRVDDEDSRKTSLGG